MPRLPRLHYDNAIYHVLTRGDGKRRLFHDEGHYERFTEGLAAQVDRCGWQVIAYCWMPNHIHALIRTPQPNLARGMQHWLSGYANWYAKRNRRSGHLYEGRYKAFPVEDEGYYWNLSRYIHLNPCNGAKPLAESPERYSHSSYAGYARKTLRVDWIDYDQHHRYWAARNGGDPESAYRKFVKAGMHSTADPALNRLKDWVYGGEEFLRRMVQLAELDDSSAEVLQGIRKSQHSIESVIAATAKEYGVDPDDYTGFRSRAPGRDVAAYLCRRYTTATLAELSRVFGLSHRDSSGDLVKRARFARQENPTIERCIRMIEKSLSLNPESRV
jgi:REP element-mobilizing transposase RayT